jgi:sucrose-6-phosphate hydrolase SacC (GH32 family)
VGGDADYADSLALLPSDEELTLRVFVDRTVLEAYWMDGRVAMTAAIVPGYAREGTAQLEVFADTDMEMRSAVAWGMESIWVSPEEVRRAAAMR